MNSESAGNSNANRGSVYIFLVGIVIILLVYVILGKRLFYNSIIESMLVFSLYYFIDLAIIKGSTSWSTFVYFGLSIWWILTIEFFYCEIRKNLQCVQSLRNFVRITFLLFSFAVLYGSANMNKNYSVGFARVGYIYHVLSMLPAILLLENNSFLKKTFILLAVFLSIFSFKRGAIIALPLTLFAYYFIENKISVRKHDLRKLLLVIIAILFVWQIIDTYSAGYLSERFTISELSDGSGRADLISIALSNVSKRGLIQLLFGIRSYGEEVMPMGPHNEWVGHLYYYGLIGVILFAIIFIQLTLVGIRLYKKKSLLAPSFFAMLAYIYFIGLVSGLYFVHSTFYLMYYIGIICGLSGYKNEDLKKTL